MKTRLKFIAYVHSQFFTGTIYQNGLALHGSAKAVVKNDKNIIFAERNHIVLSFTFTEMRALTVYGVD